MYKNRVLCLICLASLLFLESSCGYRKEDQSFRNKLLYLVTECVKYNDTIKEKEQIYSLLENVEENDYVLEQGSDDLRVKFVLAQGCIEHVLACSQALGDIKELVGIIHTPTPATPLCTGPDLIDVELLDDSIRYDVNKLLTVRSRAQIVRDYLTKGGVLYAVYPEGGLRKRSEVQQAVYLGMLGHYSGLVDWALKTNEIHPDMIGATYFFRNSENELYVFSIKARQANDPQELSEWGMWCGRVNRTAICQRIDGLFDYLATVGGPPKEKFL